MEHTSSRGFQLWRSETQVHSASCDEGDIKSKDEVKLGRVERLTMAEQTRSSMQAGGGKGERTRSGEAQREDIREWDKIPADTRRVIEGKRESFATLNYRCPGLGSWWSQVGDINSHCMLTASVHKKLNSMLPSLSDTPIFLAPRNTCRSLTAADWRLSLEPIRTFFFGTVKLCPQRASCRVL